MSGHAILLSLRWGITLYEGRVLILIPECHERHKNHRRGLDVCQ